MLPSLENKTGFVKNVFGDWEVATIIAAASGQAISVYTTGGLTGLNGGPAGTGFTDNNRPMRVPGVSCKASGDNKEQILNPAAFTLTGMRLGTVGDAGPRHLRRPRPLAGGPRRSTRTSRSARA